MKNKKHTMTNSNPVYSKTTKTFIIFFIMVYLFLASAFEVIDSNLGEMISIITMYTLSCMLIPMWPFKWGWIPILMMSITPTVHILHWRFYGWSFSEILTGDSRPFWIEATGPVSFVFWAFVLPAGVALISAFLKKKPD